MSLSAWNVWFHPRRAARELEEWRALADETESLTRQLDEERARNAELSSRMAAKAEEVRQLNEDKNRLEAEVGRLTESLQESAGKLEECKSQLTSANYELGYRRDTETQLQEFERTLGRVEEMKMNYERRIRLLRDTVTALKGRLEQQEEQSDELAVIDMTMPGAPEPSKEDEKEKPGDDWLMPLPDL